MMMHSIRGKLSNIAWFISMIIMFLIVASSIRGLVKGSVYAFFLTIPFAIAFWIIVVRTKQRFSKRSLFFLRHAISLLATFIISYFGCVYYSWDWGQLNHTAIQVAKGIGNDNPIYYLRYPNNQFWLSVLTVLCKTIRFVLGNVPDRVYQAASILFAIVMVRFSCLLIYKTCLIKFGEQRATFCDLALLLFSPLYLYAFFSYTDTAGLLCISSAVYLFSKHDKQCKEAKDNHRVFYVVCLALLISLTAKIKILCILVFLAKIISDLLDSQRKLLSVMIEWSMAIALSLVFFLIFGLLSASINQLPDNQNKKYEFSAAHFIMMGLGKTGGYQQEDVDYSISFDSYDERIEANVREIGNRLKQRGIGGTLQHIFGVKMLRTWGNSALAGDDYMSRNPVFPNSIIERFFGIRGDLHPVFLFFSWMYYILLIVGCLISPLSAENHRIDYEVLSIVGITLFLMIWECNSRYLFTYTPVIFLCSMNGWSRLYELIRQNEFNVRKGYFRLGQR